MKRASYRDTIDWIAQNDETAEMDVDVISGLPSACLVADIFGIDREKACEDIVRRRKKLQKDGEL